MWPNKVKILRAIWEYGRSRNWPPIQGGGDIEITIMPALLGISGPSHYYRPRARKNH